MEYLQKVGFDEDRKRRRLALLGLGSSDHALARYLHDKVIIPHHEEIVKQFYRLLHQDKEVQEILARGFDSQRLEETFSEYLLTLGIDFDSDAYAESRLRIGGVHILVGVSLTLYQCAYRYMMQLLIDHIPEGFEKRDLLQAFILKMAAYDMSLAIEAYYCARMQDLQLSLQSEQVRSQQLAARISRDSLTGVMSRASFLEALALAQQNLNAQQKGFALMMFDLDHFKRINDTHGHLAGDQVLVEVGKRARTALRENDFVGRYGGEEFGVLVNISEKSGVMQVAERLRGFMAAQPMPTDYGGLDISVSIGVAMARRDESIKSLIARADKALYRAKAEGRNRVELNDAVGG